MYVIFPADEVVYLSYGRLIVVPANTDPEHANSPIRTNSLPPEYSNIGHPSSTKISKSRGSTNSEPIPGSSTIEFNLVEGQPSTSRGEPQDQKNSQETKPKKKSLRLNFNLLRRSNSKNSESQGPLSSRVRQSVGHRDQSGLTIPPSEAFKRFCHISSPSTNTNNGNPSQIVAEPKKSPKEKSSSVQGLNSQERISSKRSSSSSKNSKPPSIGQEDQLSKKSSKQSSSSSKSNKQEKSPALSNNTSIFQRSQSQIQRATRKEDSRNISTSTNQSTVAFYPLATSREKNLVEPSPEINIKSRPSSFRLNLRRSKTPEVSSNQPSRPERKKDKEKKPVKPKSTLERKLSFSDFLPATRDIRPEVLVTSDREKLQVERDKPPVLSFFRKTPSPKNLGRDRTPHLSRESGLYTNQYLLHETHIEDNSRPANAGQKHTSGEGSIMRVAIFTTNSKNNIIISFALLTVDLRLAKLFVCV